MSVTMSIVSGHDKEVNLCNVYILDAQQRRAGGSPL